MIRWQFKLEPTQVLKVKVRPVGALGVREEFYARMSQDGGMTIPKLIVSILREDIGEESLVRSALEVELQPAE